jgi:uncharacterized membrane protein YhhN
MVGQAVMPEIIPLELLVRAAVKVAVVFPRPKQLQVPVTPFSVSLISTAQLVMAPSIVGVAQPLLILALELHKAPTALSMTEEAPVAGTDTDRPIAVGCHTWARMSYLHQEAERLGRSSPEAVGQALRVVKEVLVPVAAVVAPVLARQETRTRL